MYFSTQIFIYLFETIQNAKKINFNKSKTKVMSFNLQKIQFISIGKVTQ